MPKLSSEPRRMSNAGRSAWLASPLGAYLLDWEQSAVDRVVSDIFGFNALQIGLPECDFLRANRITLRQRAGEDGMVDLRCQPTALPFAAHSIDLVVLPHVLEFSADPHQILREVERILIPEGQVIVLGFNPYSPWGLRQRFDRSGRFPWNGSYLSLSRLRDWLKLLGFEPDRGTLGGYVLPIESRRRPGRTRTLERLGARCWRFSGAVYLLRAIKRTHGLRLIRPEWRQTAPRTKALRPAVHKERSE